MKHFINYINNSKILLALFIIILNIITKHINLELTEKQIKIIKGNIGKELFIFILVFISTRDIIVSIISTILFSIILNHLFNENSRFCIIENNIKFLDKMIEDNQNDNNNNNNDTDTDNETDYNFDNYDDNDDNDDNDNDINLFCNSIGI